MKFSETEGKESERFQAIWAQQEGELNSLFLWLSYSKMIFPVLI